MSKPFVEEQDRASPTNPDLEEKAPSDQIEELEPHIHSKTVLVVLVSDKFATVHIIEMDANICIRQSISSTLLNLSMWLVQVP